MTNSDHTLDLYRVADENHRFYVDKRFTIISFYFPATTLIASGLYFLSPRLFRPVATLAGIVLTVFLYLLEYRNWILSNTALDCSKDLGNILNGDDNLHVKLKQSCSADLSDGSTPLDRFLKRLADKRKTAISQHRTVFGLTCFLVVYWIALALLSL